MAFTVVVSGSIPKESVLAVTAGGVDGLTAPPILSVPVKYPPAFTIAAVHSHPGPMHGGHFHSAKPPALKWPCVTKTAMKKVLKNHDVKAKSVPLVASRVASRPPPLAVLFPPPLPPSGAVACELGTKYTHDPASGLPSHGLIPTPGSPPGASRDVYSPSDFKTPKPSASGTAVSPSLGTGGTTGGHTTHPTKCGNHNLATGTVVASRAFIMVKAV